MQHYKLLKYYSENGGFKKEELSMLALGNIIAFIVAIIAIKFFIGLLKKHGFRIWGIYRIILGVLLFILMYTGIINP